MLRTVIVAGASLGALRAVEQLRAAGWRDQITVVGAERHMPYNRPPLSKGMLQDVASGAGAGSAADWIVAASAFPVRVDSERLEWRLGSRLVSASFVDREVGLADGTTLSYDGLVVATGLRPRRLPLEGGQYSRYVLRTADDAAALGRALATTPRVVVVGGGFIGCEVAATARKLGCTVTVIEPLCEPMLGPLGLKLAMRVRTHHEHHGIRFLLGRFVTAIESDSHGRVANVGLDNGDVVSCDVLVEAIGSHPNVEWLEGNELDLSNGVICDERMRVEGRSDVVAVGDIARYPSVFLGGDTLRTEHWCVPGDTARRAGPALVAHLNSAPLKELGQPPLSTFWSDQFELRVQGLGAPGVAEEHSVLQGDVDDLNGGVAIGAWRRGALVGVVAVGLSPVALRPYRDRLLETSVAAAPA